MNHRKRNYFLFIFIFLLTANFIQPQAQPYVLLISFDGFRWDYINRNVAPNLDELIKNGVSASSLMPVYPTKTFPNHISIVTGMCPENHGIIANEFIDIKNNSEYKMWDTSIVRNSEWYKGEAFWETAKSNGIITASYFWPSSDIKDSLRTPDYYYTYEHKKPYKDRVDGIINWLTLPYEKRPHFITLYFDLTDGIGHKFGPNSEEINIAIAQVDSQLAAISKGLEKVGLLDSVNLIITSDHGMAEVSDDRLVVIDEKIEGFDFTTSNSGAFMMIYANADKDEIYNILKKEEDHYKVYKREQVPEYYHFSNNSLIGNMVLMSDTGWRIITKKNVEWIEDHPYSTKGEHGYDNYHLDMHGVFVAAGPSFKANYKTGMLKNIDIYPLLCKIFNITPAENIDGDLSRIEYILK